MPRDFYVLLFKREWLKNWPSPGVVTKWIDLYILVKWNSKLRWRWVFLFFKFLNLSFIKFLYGNKNWKDNRIKKLNIILRYHENSLTIFLYLGEGAKSLTISWVLSLEVIYFFSYMSTLLCKFYALSSGFMSKFEDTLPLIFQN